MQLALYTKATHTSCDLAPITQRANFCTLFNTAKKAGGARKAKVGQTLPTYYGEDSFREIDRGHDGETVVCASVAWFSSVLLDPVAPPPSLGGADAHAAALSGPQNLHLTHGGRSAADNHPPAAAFDTHKLQKRRTEREARKMQARTRTRTRTSLTSPELRTRPLWISRWGGSQNPCHIFPRRPGRTRSGEQSAGCPPFGRSCAWTSSLLRLFKYETCENRRDF